MKWLRKFFKKFRREKSVTERATREDGPLREFVYLNETSVISLLASRKGAIPQSITEALTNSSSAQFSSEAGSSNPLASAKVGSQFQSDRSQSLEIVRQAVVQSQFKLLYDVEIENLAVTIPETFEKDRLDQLLRKLPKLIEDGTIIALSSLRRGELVELNVLLHADDVLAFTSAVSSVSDLVKDHPEKFGVDNRTLLDITTLNTILERLLIGLVPVRGRCTDFRVLRHETENYLVPINLIHAEEVDDRRLGTIDVVAVTERPLYWRDLRQVLFSDSQYTMLCRVMTNGVSSTWNAVKMLDVLDDIAPGVRDELQDMVRGFTSGARALTSRVDQADPAAIRRAALLGFADGLALELGLDAPRDALDSRGVPTDQDCDTSVATTAQWEAFDRVAEVVTGQTAADLNRDLVTSLRTRALSSSAALDSARENVPLPMERGRPEVLLESEVVAIYW